ncbi:MAG TPA: hypothetical protein VGJ28_14950, partial [Micromonosporaceae bacterium]
MTAALAILGAPRRWRVTIASLPSWSMIEAERLWLDDTAWVDLARGWLPDADAVFEEVLARTAWQQGRIWRYEKWIDENRLGGHSGRDPH